MAIMSKLYPLFLALTIVLACTDSTTVSSTSKAAVNHGSGHHHTKTAHKAQTATSSGHTSTGAAAASVGKVATPGKVATSDNGVQLAPQPNDPIPGDAAIYHANGTTIDMTDFYYWRQEVRDKSDKGQAYKSRFIKVEAGTYQAVWTDENHSNIDVTFWDGGDRGWTLDLRGVSIEYQVGPGAPNPFFYVNQAPPTFTILGGSIWQDVGEIWSQADVLSVEPNPSAGFDMSKVTAKLQKGYDLKPWTDSAASTKQSRSPPKVWGMNVSDPNHYKRTDINLWYMNFDSMTTSPDGTITFSVTSRGHVSKGDVLSVLTGNEMATTLVNEENHGLHVKGLTCNGGFTYIGHDSAGPPHYEDVLVANPPSPEGLAPRVNGPTMSHGHMDNFELCEFAPCDTYTNSFWMYTGNPKDLAVLEEGAKLPN